MNADHHFEIGKDHKVCEDYALSGIAQNGAYVIVCDGCSASPDVDFGARVLAFSARRTLGMITDLFCYEGFGEVTINKSEKIFDLLPLHPQALDATLLVAWVKNDQLTAYIYGDGLFYHKAGDKVTTTHVSFSLGAPAYLSYNLDSGRLLAYKSMCGKKVVETNGTVNIVEPFDPVIIKTTVLPGDVIGVCSDGINQFKKADGEPIPWQSLLPEYFGYKTTEGVFVNRRISAFKRKCLKDQVSHLDDISVGTIIV